MVEMEDIRGVRLRKFNLRKIILGVRMHFHHNSRRDRWVVSFKEWSLVDVLLERLRIPVVTSLS